MSVRKVRTIDTKGYFECVLAFCGVDARPATLFKKRLQHRCFPMNVAKFARTPIS